jgi:hypothetical protein
MGLLASTSTLSLRGLKPGLYTVLVQLGDEAPRRATLVVEF